MANPYRSFATDVVAKTARKFDVGNLVFYVSEQLFHGISLEGKSLIDVGGGSGLLSYYAALNGASKVTVLEPEVEGSYSGMIKEFQQFREIAGNLNYIELINKTIQEYKPEGERFDIVLFHNSINHIDEEACINLLTDAEARERYRSHFRHINSISNARAKLILCDCARTNAFSTLGLRNPFAPSIEWHKHQGPQTWSRLASTQGFREESIRWTTLNKLGKFGTVLMSNWPASYVTRSHFRLVMEKTEEASTPPAAIRHIPAQ